jgi:pyruvate dehydrogenase E1 component alpha subunit
MGAELGDLADPLKYRHPIDIADEDFESLKGQLAAMMKIRLVEQHLAAMRRDGLIGGPVHLGVGQEAIAVGVSASLTSADVVFGAHRSHSHVLALGSSMHGLFAEVLGKQTGLSGGMGGSMHLWDGPRGFAGSVPIVAGTVPLAVGAGLAAKLKGSASVSVSYLGDGAIEEGAVHESLNLARIMNLPVLFVLENNLFSSHMHISLRQPLDSTARFAEASDIPFEVVDGNDVVAVRKAAAHLVDRARSGGGPGFVEAITARWYGHVDWRDDIDVGVNRSASDVQNWRRRDPIARLTHALANCGAPAEQWQREIERSLRAEIAVAWERAMADPYPPESAMLNHVYSR